MKTACVGFPHRTLKGAVGEPNVIPAQAGIQGWGWVALQRLRHYGTLDSRFRGNDGAAYFHGNDGGEAYHHFHPRVWPPRGTVIPAMAVTPPHPAVL